MLSNLPRAILTTMVDSNSPSLNNSVAPFDRVQLRNRRNRVADKFSDHAFLIDEVGVQLAERLKDVKRSFKTAVDLGCRDGRLTPLFSRSNRIENFLQCDLSESMLAKAEGPYKLVADEEWLPFAPESIDLVISALNLHWVNDLPGTLIQIRRALRPDGLLSAAIIGGNSLTELRQALIKAESQIDGGISPRVAPFIDIQDLGALLQRAGFNLPVIDTDTITASYPNALKLMKDIKGMGESNILKQRQGNLKSRSVLITAAQHYQQMFGDSNGRISATFEILYFAGWKPHNSQQKPLKPGTAKMRLTDILGSTK